MAIFEVYNDDASNSLAFDINKFAPIRYKEEFYFTITNISKPAGTANRWYFRINFQVPKTSSTDIIVLAPLNIIWTSDMGGVTVTNALLEKWYTKSMTEAEVRADLSRACFIMGVA